MKIGDKVKSLVWHCDYLATVDAIVIDVDQHMVEIAYIVLDKKLYGWVPRLAIFQ
jgi:hypothetical protein